MREESNSLRLGFDAKRIFNNKTGLGNYGRSFLSGLYEHFPNENYHLYSPDKGSISLPAGLRDKQNVFIHTAHGLAALWRTFGIKKDLVKDRIQLYHGLSNEIPVGLKGSGVKTVVTIHDLIFKRYPFFFPVIDRKIYDFKFHYACKNADRVIALSQSTARDIVYYYKINESRIKVIYQPCDRRFLNAVSEEEISKTKHKLGLPSPYLLYVGSVTPRKNLMLVAEALALLPEDLRLPLVVVGTGGRYLEQVKRYVKDHSLEVHFMDKIESDDLPAIYGGASIFIYPSFYEGFGLPIQEALLSEVPVIAANTSSLPEAGGPDSIYIDPENPQELANAIERVISDAEMAKRMKVRGKNYALNFQKQDAIVQVHDLYLEVLAPEIKNV